MRSGKDYRSIGRKALADNGLLKALADVQGRLGPATAQAYRDLPEGPALRFQAHEIRKDAIENLDVLLTKLADTLRRHGGHVYFAPDGDAAVKYCLDVARKNGIRSVIKGKSMVTEEIQLNDHLMAQGIEVTEADLGEYIVQLAGEHPSHIIAPAVHKTRDQIGRLFAEKLDMGVTDDPLVLTQAARKALRKKFLTADMGITGCNLACAETGHITTVSNEGNIRMASTLPRIHMVFMGMERITARLQDHDILIRLLARAAAAQDMPVYVSYVGGPADKDHADGPEQFHLVILDNGRSRILADRQLRHILYCIRCAACLNVCPVYAKVGGYAYGHPYSGPIGAVLTPLLTNLVESRDLCFGETLCGACQQACPVNIDIPGALLALRRKLANGDSHWQLPPSLSMEKILYAMWTQLTQHPKLYNLFWSLAGRVSRILPGNQQMIRNLPYPLNGWTRGRDAMAPAPQRFTQRWKQNRNSN